MFISCKHTKRQLFYRRQMVKRDSSNDPPNGSSVYRAYFCSEEFLTKTIPIVANVTTTTISINVFLYAHSSYNGVPSGLVFPSLKKSSSLPMSG